MSAKEQCFLLSLWMDAENKGGNIPFLSLPPLSSSIGNCVLFTSQRHHWATGAATGTKTFWGLRADDDREPYKVQQYVITLKIYIMFITYRAISTSTGSSYTLILDSIQFKHPCPA